MRKALFLLALCLCTGALLMLAPSAEAYEPLPCADTCTCSGGCTWQCEYLGYTTTCGDYGICSGSPACSGGGGGCSCSNPTYGTSGGDTINGSGNDDCIKGRGGHDTIYGNAGEDDLFGEGGNDTLYGGSGNDCLDGGSGTDNLRGDSGSDVCVNGESYVSCND